MLIIRCQIINRNHRIICHIVRNVNGSSSSGSRSSSSGNSRSGNIINNRSNSSNSIDWINTTVDNIVDNKSINIDTIKDIYAFSLKSLRLNKSNKQQLSYGQSTLYEEDDASLLVLNSLSLPLLGSNITKNSFILDDGIKKYGSRMLTRDNKVTIITRLKQRIVNRIPMAYLVNGCYQQGEYFYVNNNVLIPRSFIGDVLADSNLSELMNIKTITKVCDLCTGTGALAILSTKYLPNVKKVHAIDICNKALEVCTINVNNKNLNEVITAYQSDLFNNIDVDNKYDLILCNPPYVDKQGMNKLPPEYKVEPSLALTGGITGLDLIERIIQTIIPRLRNDNSGLLLEIGRTKKSLEKKYHKLCANATWLTTELSEDEVLYITKKDLMNSL